MTNVFEFPVLGEAVDRGKGMKSACKSELHPYLLDRWKEG